MFKTIFFASLTLSNKNDVIVKKKIFFVEIEIFLYVYFIVIILLIYILYDIIFIRT